jgi:hypothetical protein
MAGVAKAEATAVVVMAVGLAEEAREGAMVAAREAAKGEETVAAARAAARAAVAMEVVARAP